MAIDTVDAINAISKSRPLGELLLVSLVGVVQSAEVGGDRQGTVDNGILGREVGLEEIVGVRHEGTVHGCKPVNSPSRR